MEYPTHDPVIPNFHLDDSTVEYTSVMLRQLVSMEYVLYVKLQNFHWNVTGWNFYSLHQFFGQQYEELGKFIDRIAEQIRKYGRAAPGAMQEFIQNSLGLEERPGVLLDAQSMVAVSLSDHEAIVTYLNSLQPNMLDLATQNLLGEILDWHMKYAWMLRAHQE